MPRRPLNLLVYLLLAAAPALVSGADIGIITPAADQTDLWVRQVIRLRSVDSQQPAQLRVRGVGRASVYVNGQRLLRQARLTAEQPLQLDVSSLIRQGANGIAVSLHREQDGPQPEVAVWLNHAGQTVAATDAAWKQKNSLPPIGWQQTDFNTHGWTSAVVARTTTTDDFAAESWKEHQWQRTAAVPMEESRLTLAEGDHVVLLGGTFLERAQVYGHLEAALSALTGEKQVTFRNLGWSGDTVFAESRGIFATPQQGFQRLIEHIRAEEPTVVLVCYGQNEAMTNPGKQAIRQFGEQLQKLTRTLASTGTRFVFVSPHPLLSAAPPVPSPHRYNPVIEKYVVEMQRIAQAEHISFIDLFSGLPQGLQQAQQRLAPLDDFDLNLVCESSRWTDNGMHWNDAGYRRISMLFAERSLQQTLAAPVLKLAPAQKTVTADSAQVRNIEWTGRKTVHLEFRSDTLSPAPLVVTVPGKATVSVYRAENTAAVPLVQQTTHQQTTAVLQLNPEWDQLTGLLQRKNELYFHRWRPQNITYLYGFRKHEQGNNAAEIAMFDPLVAELETQIHQAKQPQWQRLQIHLQ